MNFFSTQKTSLKTKAFHTAISTFAILTVSTQGFAMGKKPAATQESRAKECCLSAWGLQNGNSYRSKATAYYPHNSAMEGGFYDRLGKPLRTLQGYLKGKAEYVSAAMDAKVLPYGAKICIPELNQAYGAVLPIKVVDTGGAFKNKGMSRIDVCTANRQASLDPAVNSHLTIIVCRNPKQQEQEQEPAPQKQDGSPAQEESQNQALQQQVGDIEKGSAF